MIGSCHMCGKCCEAIHILKSPEEIAKMARNYHEDARFIHDNWTNITKEEAFQINPHFAEMESRGVNYSMMNWYTCQQHDKETKLCKVHDSRPDVCSGYPWYDHGPHGNEPFYNMDCGYREDVPEEKWNWAKKEVEQNVDS